MLKYTFIFLLLFSVAYAQQLDVNIATPKAPPPEINKLLKRLPKLKQDTARVNTYSKISRAYTQLISDSVKNKGEAERALYWADQQFTLANQLHWQQGMADATFNKAEVYQGERNFKKALELLQKAAEIPADITLQNKIALLTGWLYFQTGKYKQSEELIDKIMPGIEAGADKQNITNAYMLKGVSGVIKGDFKLYLTYNLKALKMMSPTDTSQAHINFIESAAQAYRLNQQLPQAIQMLQKAQQLQHNKKRDVQMDYSIANIYNDVGDFAKATAMYKKTYTDAVATNDTSFIRSAKLGLAEAAYGVKNYDNSIGIYQELGHSDKAVSRYNSDVGLALNYYSLQKYAAAITYVKKAQEEARKKPASDYVDEMNASPGVLGEIYLDAPDSALTNAGLPTTDRYQKAVDVLKRNISSMKRLNLFYDLAELYQNLSRAYEKLQDHAQALDAYKQYVATKDSLDKWHDKNEVIRREGEYNFARREDSLKYRELLSGNQLRNQLKISNQQKNIEALSVQKTQASLQAEQNRRQANEQKLKATQKEQALAGVQLQLQKSEISSGRLQGYYLMAGIAVLLLLSVFIGRNYYNQRRSNKLISAANLALDQQRAEVTEQRDKLNDTIKELKATQQQLVQSEKMASLGELTAGIAHEIQNPLNFVNNFAEVSTELIEELDTELDGGDVVEAKAIAADIKQNLTKIYHHGKRADGIVKGMLEHSRTSTGQKEPTDLNKLADEYLRLAYHGLRAKDKSFNAELITHFDETLPLIKIIPQDIGRVLLNLFNNAFYAVLQKQKKEANSYKPEIILKTLYLPFQGVGGLVVLTVSDNGTGIPAAIKDKVMQPFFTTKPTGEGTGLGLSLSYDIVVKAHNGKMIIESVEGEGTTFSVELPAG